MEATQSTLLTISEIPWYLKDLFLPLLITFTTYLVSQLLFKPVSKWRRLKDELITVSIQYANYKAYIYFGKNGKRKFDDPGMIVNLVEQKLRRLAGKICVLSDYQTYKFWRGWLIPNEKLIDEIRGDLIGWANSLVEKDLKYDAGREVRIESLKMHLGLPNDYEDMRAMQKQEWESNRKR